MRHLRLVTTPLAQDDIDEQALYIAGENLEAGLRFLDAIDRARYELCRLPQNRNRAPIRLFHRIAIDLSTRRRRLHRSRKTTSNEAVDLDFVTVDEDPLEDIRVSRITRS